MMILRIFLLLFGITLFADTQPFKWDWKADNGTLTVSLQTAPGAYVYKESTSMTLDSAKPSVSPKAIEYTDDIMGKTEIYKGKTEWIFKRPAKQEALLILSWQGCSAKKGESPRCYPPETLEIKLKIDKNSSGTIYPEETEKAAASSGLYPDVKIERSAFGYLNAKEFTAFLEGKQADVLSFAGKGIILVLILTLLGGIALNLTPCVLPMIPINLAIIGADSENKRSAVTRGFAYAAGIALAYGIVGLSAVLGGATFGTLSSIWYFNLGAAIVFLILGLSMFDLFSIDLSRYGGGIKTPSTAKLAGVFLLGGLSALLAGACVAPVLIAVLLHSANLYAGGNPFGLFLPFLLGIGMGIPWVLASAGIARLPKPGKWMLRVKYAFGVIIILMGIYYGYLGANLLFGSHKEKTQVVNTQQLAYAFAQSSKNGKPVLIDFWAEWCKNCKAMDAGTMKDAEVRKALEKFNFVKFDATNVSDPQIKAVMERFKVTGLPAFVIARTTNEHE